MSTGSSFLSDVQLQCPICLDVFTDPVSIPCGHNFCKACISRHWMDKEHCLCPMCKAEFSNSLRLCVNTTFREVVENFKKMPKNGPKNETLVKPEDVLCDCCLHSKCKASKTCLVCLASYCEIHLESHHRVPALKRHKLTDPVHNLEGKICKKHNMILESLCSNDPTPACALCIKHDTAPVKEEREDQKPLKVKRNEVQGRKGKQRNNAKRKNDKHEASANSVEDSEDCSDVLIWCDPYFINFSKLPLNRGITKGRFYYEVHINEQRNWYLGVVSESLRWKKIFGPNDVNRRWLIAMLTCSKCKDQNPDVKQIPEIVWVCVDYDQGTVFFCDADTRTPFFILTECRFRQKIFLFHQPAPFMECSPCSKPVNTWLVACVVFFMVMLCCILFFNKTEK